ncbi:MAG: hypothetical protein ACJ0DJ_00160 [bacterium]|nr:hypothetical protein [Deltaproteobacteria bacterium]
MDKKIKKLLLTIGLLFFTTQVWAVKAKIRFLFPFSSKSVADGFEDSTIKTSEFVVAFLMPLSQHTVLDLGYSYFNARIEDPSTSSEGYSGVFRAHLLELGAGYSGFELTRTISLVFESSVRVPISGEGEVQGNQATMDATGISGMGYYFSSGVEYRDLEISLFYQRRDLSFDGLTVSRNGKRNDVALHSTEYGIAFGYTFF